MVTIAEWILESGNCKVAGLSINSPSLSTEIELSAIQSKCKKTMKTKAYKCRTASWDRVRWKRGVDAWVH